MTVHWTCAPKVQWTFQWFSEHSLCKKEWCSQPHHIFLNICNEGVHSLEQPDLNHSSIMKRKSLYPSYTKHQLQCEASVNTRYHDFVMITDHVQLRKQQQCLLKQVTVCYAKKFTSSHDCKILCNMSWVLMSACMHFYCQSCRLRWLHLIFLKRDWTLSESKQYFDKSSLSFTTNSTMSSVMSLSCERIDASHFWLSGATTTSEDKQRKREYLEGLKNTVQHQLQMYHSQLRPVFSLISMTRSLNHWRQFRISWYKFIKIRIIASAADHKICYNQKKWKAWSWWMTWISADSYQWLWRNWNTMINEIWLCMNA